MLSAIDAGNSTMDVSCLAKRRSCCLASLESDRRKTAYQLAVDLMNLFALYRYDWRDVTGETLCSMVPALDAAVEKAVARLPERPCCRMFPCTRRRDRSERIPRSAWCRALFTGRRDAGRPDRPDQRDVPGRGGQRRRHRRKRAPDRPLLPPHGPL